MPGELPCVAVGVGVAVGDGSGGRSGSGGGVGSGAGSGSAPRTVHVRRAGVRSTLPARSTACTSSVCGPSCSSSTVSCSAHSNHAWWSSRHRRLATGSLAPKPNAAVRAAVLAGGPAVIVVCGAVLSTVTSTGGEVPALPERSKATAVILAGPSGSVRVSTSTLASP